MAWNLPPGCTDADIDRAAPGYDEANAYQCDCCGRMVEKERIGRVWAYGIETYACDKCRGWEDEE